MIPWTAAGQASLSITSSWSLLKLMSIELVMPSNHLILCPPLLLLPPIFPSIRVFSNESALRTRCPKYWSFSFSISPSNEYSGLIFLRMDGLDLPAVHWLAFQVEEERDTDMKTVRVGEMRKSEEGKSTYLKIIAFLRRKQNFQRRYNVSWKGLLINTCDISDE